MGYELADENTTEIKRLFDANPRAARAIAIKLAVNIALGYPVPDGLRAFTGLLLIGEVAMTKPRAVKPSLAHRDYLLVGLAKCIQSEIGLPLASNSAVLSSGKPRPVTASVLAAASLYVHGAAVNIEQAARIIYENGKSRQRIDIHGPIFFPESLPLYGNALASRFSRFDMEGLDVLRQKAVDWPASSL